MNENIADITVLEGLQNRVNAQFGSSMSAFQSVAVENATYKEIRKPATPDEAKEIEKLKKELESLEKDYDTKVPPIFKDIDKTVLAQEAVNAKILKLKSELEQTEAKQQTLKTQESQLYGKADQTQGSIVPKSATLKSKLASLGVEVVKCTWDNPPKR